MRQSVFDDSGATSLGNPTGWIVQCAGSRYNLLRNPTYCQNGCQETRGSGNDSCLLRSEAEERKQSRVGKFLESTEEHKEAPLVAIELRV